MDEDDLRGLADEPGGPGEPGEPVPRRRPVDAVLGRSRQIHRRRRAAQALGASALVVGLVGAGTWARQPEREPDLATASPGPAARCPADPEPADPAAAFGQSPGHVVHARELPVADAADDGLLLLPADLPDGQVIQASALRYDRPCPDGPLLALQADGDDATVDATIKLLGPYGEPLDGPHYVGHPTSDATSFRGRDAIRITVPDLPTREGEGTLLAFTWTDASGATWLLESQNVDEATLRAVGEALVIDPSSTPPADIPAGAVPSGWELAWRHPALPTGMEALDPEITSWSVELGGSPGAGGCSLRVATTTAADAPEVAFAVPGQEVVTVRGRPALVVAGNSVQWNEPSGASVLLSCGAGTEDLVAMAESLAPIEPDDPRLP